MNVLIDARKLFDGGIGVYLRNTIQGLLQHPEVRLTALISSAVGDDPRAATALGSCSRFITRQGLYSWGELFTLAREIPWEQFDLFHVPHYTLPVRVPVPTVVTIHDVTHVFHPQRWYYPVVAGPLIAATAIRATRIIAVSYAAQSDLLRLLRGYQRVAQKITVIPNAVQCTTAAEAVPCNDMEQQPYLVAVVSTNKPHKGVADLLQAFQSVAGRFRGWQLRLIGYGIEPAAPVQVGNGAWIHRIGPVDDMSLTAAYAGARGVIVASTAEGFCIPVLEAHAAGVRVGARPVPAIREILTAWDFVAGDFSVESLGVILEQLMTAPPPDGVALKRHAAEYGIESCTERLLRVYREATRGN